VTTRAGRHRATSSGDWRCSRWCSGDGNAATGLVTTLGLGLGGTRPLKQMGRDLAGRFLLFGRHLLSRSLRRCVSSCLCGCSLRAGLLGSLPEMFGDFGHRLLSFVLERT
jgi:hypothetical protein